MFSIAILRHSLTQELAVSANPMYIFVWNKYLSLESAIAAHDRLMIIAFDLGVEIVQSHRFCVSCCLDKQHIFNLVMSVAL